MFVCVEGCTSNAQCTGASAPTCNTTTAKCVECAVDSQCPSGEYCDPTGACVECLVDGNCAVPTPICSNEACVQCATTADCAPQQLCIANKCAL